MTSLNFHGRNDVHLMLQRVEDSYARTNQFYYACKWLRSNLSILSHEGKALLNANDGL